MASLLIVVDEVRADVATIPGLNVPDDFQPEQYNGPWPVAVIRMDSGAWQWDTASDFGGVPSRFGLHTLNVKLLHPRKDLPRDLRRVAALDAALVNTLMKGATEAAGGDRFNDSIVGLGNLATNAGGGPPIRYSTGSFDFGGVTCVSIQYEVDVTVEEQVI